MGLVMKTSMVEGYLSSKMAIKDGATVNVAIDGVTHLDIVTYPAQEKFEEGAVLALIQKPFINFAAECGAAGDMTVEKISEKYGDQIPAELAATLVEDFAKAYGNYVIIPNEMTLAITQSPIKSIFDLLIEEKPAEEDAPVEE